MMTRFYTKVTPVESTGEGWMKVITEDGREREWHIRDMRLEENEPPEVQAVIDAAMDECHRAAVEEYNKVK